MLVPNTVNSDVPAEAESMYPESHLCPWNQTLPFVLRAVPQLEQMRDKILNPTVHFRYGYKHVEKALADFARARLKISRATSNRAVAAAYAAQAKFSGALQELGGEALATLERTNEPAIVLVGRAYNLYDRGINCDIPRKLRSLYGVNVLPMDFLPVELEDIRERQPEHVLELGAANPGRGSNHPTLPEAARRLHLQLQVRPGQLYQVVHRRRRAQTLAGAAIRRTRQRRGIHYPLRSLSRFQRISAMSKGCRHLSRKIGPDHPLAGKTVYIPTMADGSAEAFAAVFRWLGVDALPTPPSDERTRELGGRYTNGDECYPAKVVVGDFIRVIEQPGFDAKRTMFFMPTADGPCRFGQYAPMLEKVLRENGYGDVQILSPTSKNSYADLGEISTPFMRAGWRALVAASVLRKALHRTRPYETVPGSSDKVYEEGHCRPVLDHRERLFEHRLPARFDRRGHEALRANSSAASRSRYDDERASDRRGWRNLLPAEHFQQ